MMRGINRQNIFEDKEDRYKFLEILKNCKELSSFELLAFCLMSNHVHLLIRIVGEPLDLVIKRIGSRYVQWYNKKYDRIGHLFQDRFRSENVEDDQYLLTVFRYIQQNPMKAGLEEEPGTYPWNSYLAYREGCGSITDTEMITGMFSSRESLIRFMKEPCTDRVMDDEDTERRLSDEEAREILHTLSGCRTVAEFQKMTSAEQRETIIKLFKYGLTPGQIVKLTGKSPAMIYRYRGKEGGKT